MGAYPFTGKQNHKNKCDLLYNKEKGYLIRGGISRCVKLNQCQEPVTTDL